ncbi:hypothetical protein [Enterobacter phage Phc]|nr:hypothetical protein [Enterobacter phage Phc]
MKKNNVNLVRVKLNTDGYFRDSDSMKCWLKSRTFPVIVKAEIVYSSENGYPAFAKVPMEECVAIGMNPAIFKGLENCGLNWYLFPCPETGELEAEIL